MVSMFPSHFNSLLEAFHTRGASVLLPRSHHVAQTVVALVSKPGILLPLPPKGWDYRCALPPTAHSSLFKFNSCCQKRGQEKNKAKYMKVLKTELHIVIWTSEGKI